MFAEPDVTITAGQSIKWVAKDADVPHHLVDDGTNEDITPEFQSPVMPTHKFEKAGIIKYHCTHHPDTMRGTITVK
jgi:plastocyanin